MLQLLALVTVLFATSSFAHHTPEHTAAQKAMYYRGGYFQQAWVADVWNASQGVTWLATTKGVVLTQDSGSKTILPEVSFTSISGDRFEKVWAGSEKGIYQIYLDIYGNLQSVQVPNVPTGRVQSIAAYGLSSIFAGINDGLYFFNGEGWKAASEFKKKRVYKLAKGTEGELLATTSDGAYLHRNNAWTPIPYTDGRTLITGMFAGESLLLSSRDEGVMYFPTLNQQPRIHSFSALKMRQGFPIGAIELSNGKVRLTNFNGEYEEKPLSSF
jgi:ligand-binding sensor domain-containing protein